MTPTSDEPSIPPRLQRPLAAVWISLGLHAALIALVQVAPPASVGQGPMIEARLVSAHGGATPAASAAPLQPERPEPQSSALPPAEAADALPVEAPTDHAVVSPLPQVDATAPVAAPAEPVAAQPTTGISLPVDLTYYSARELDVQPRARSRVDPVYPDDAVAQRMSGRVRLQLKLEADGRVSAVEVVEADPPGVFDASAVRAFRAARFSPAQRGGRPVRALLLIEVEYDWEGQQ